MAVLIKATVSSAVTQPADCVQSTLGDLRATVGALPLGESPRTSCSSSVSCAIMLPDDSIDPYHEQLSTSFGALDEYQMSIAASERGLLSSGHDAELPSSVEFAHAESDSQLTAMLALQATKVTVQAPYSL